MNNLIERITDAIIRQEGMPADYTNPGNLRDAPWFPYLTDAKGRKVLLPAIGPKPAYPVRYYPDTVKQDGECVYLQTTDDDPAKGFWIPRTRREGIAGALHLVALGIAKGYTLRQLISVWAPPTDNNNTEAYIRNVKNWAQIPDENAQLWDYL